MRTSHGLIYAAMLVGTVFGSGEAHAQTSLAYVQPLPSAAVQSVQQRLRQEGLYVGAADGVWGPESRSALERYQQNHQLQVTGQLNQATAATMGLDPNTMLAPQTASDAPVAPGEALRPASVRAVQARLRSLGFYNGPVDGVWGAATQTAIERFQQGRALQVNGQLNPATVTALGLAPDAVVAR